MARVCLAMIVRDAEKTVERAIKSTAAMVNEFLIIDTGSVDETLRVALKATNAIGLTGVFRESPWVSHAHNRSELLEHVRQSGADYALMIDADMELAIEGEVPELTADEYMIPIRDRGLVYPLPLLTSTRKRFRYEGVTHAYLVCDDGPSEGIMLQNVALIDHGGGGGRPGKIERDVELLAEAVAKNPQDARSWFYLAQSYRDLDRHLEAITAYRMRASLGGWGEEVYQSLYQAGMLLSAHVNFFDGAQLLLEAAKMKPNRAEALRGLSGCANAVANKIPFPDTEVLFVEEAAYTKPRVQLARPLPVASEQELPPLPVLKPSTRKRLPKKRPVDERDVTAIIVTRGNVDLTPILDTLPYEDIIVWDNAFTSDDAEIIGSRIRVVGKRHRDYKIFGRYAAVPYARNPLIYWQDDDIIFTSHEDLLDAFAYYQEGYVICNMDEPWLRGAGYIDTPLGLLGAGSLCPVTLPQKIWADYFAQHPWDDDALVEADFAFGTLAPTVRVDLGYETREFADAPDRLYQQPGQTERKWRMIERCMRMLQERDAA